MSCRAHGLAKSRGMLDLEDVDLIRQVVKGLADDALIVDIGAGSGTSALAVYSERRDARVLTIDVNPEMVGWAKKALEGCGLLSPNWQPIVGRSVEAASRCSDGSVSFLMVDGGHEVEEVAADIVAWLPKVRDGGFIMFHDYDAQDSPTWWPGVKKAVDVFLERGALQCVERRGWSLLAQKPSEL